MIKHDNKNYLVILFIMSILLGCDQQPINVESLTPITQDSLIGNWLVVNYYEKEISYGYDGNDYEVSITDRPYDSIFDKFHNARIFQFTSNEFIEYIPDYLTSQIKREFQYELDGTTITIENSQNAPQSHQIYMEDDKCVFEFYGKWIEDDILIMEIWNTYTLSKYSGDFPISAWSEEISETEKDFPDNDSLKVTSDTIISGFLDYEDIDHVYINAEAGKKYLIYVKSYIDVSLEVKKDYFTVLASSSDYSEHSRQYNIGDEVSSAVVFLAYEDRVYDIVLKPHYTDLEGYFELNIEETDLESTNERQNLVSAKEEK